MGLCNGLARQDGVEGISEIFTSHRKAIGRAAGIELTAVSELVLAVEKEEVWGAGGMIGLGHFLGLVEEIGKHVAALFGFVDHLFG